MLQELSPQSVQAAGERCVCVHYGILGHDWTDISAV